MRQALLMDICDKIEPNELATMKNCCREHRIAARRLQEITDPYDLFDELKKISLLTPEIVVELLEKADRIDLRNVVLQEAPSGGECSATASNLGVDRRAPITNGVLNYRHLDDISEDLDGNWKDLGRKFGIQAPILHNIDNENHYVKEKAFQMLARWKKRNGENATGQTLADALVAIGRKDVAETLADVCQPDGIIIHISEENVHLSQNRRNNSGGLKTMKADLAPNLPSL